MYAVEVDFEVFKQLTARRETESVTYNDVIRRLLGLGTDGGKVQSVPMPVPTPTRTSTPMPTPVSSTGEWIAKGVAFPAGTEFRATYRGRTHTGRVEAGRLVVAGKGYESPSAAAGAITNGPVNGWTFWECRRPGEPNWRIIKGLRSGR